MTTERQKQQAIFPNLPRSWQVIDEKGVMTSDWQLYHQQLNMALQSNFKPEGFVIPPKPTTDIALLGNTAKSIGNIIYDITTQEFKGIFLVSIDPDGTVVTVTKTFTAT